MDYTGNQAQPTHNPGSPAAPGRQPSAPNPQNFNPLGGGDRPANNMQSQHNSSQNGNNSAKMILVVLVVLAVLVFAGAAFMAFTGKDGMASSSIQKDKYQAVFLTNGQVYFGKIDKINSQYVTLSKIYYLQVQQTVQPDQQQQQEGQQPQVSLAKLGSELHGPEDAMYISRDQVLFWENLKNEGKVVEAIKADQNK